MQLGRLKEVPVRQLWKHEQYDFSKWIAHEENIELLNEILGLTLVDVDKEVYVGAYRCDIVAQDETTGVKVIIENQLEPSNHDHLGKIITYLLYCEDRRTHQCHPSYRTIASAVHLTVTTVMKHITKLEDRQLISVEHTSYLDSHGMKWNGNNQYTILPIQMTLNCCYQQQMDQLEKQRKWQQAKKRLGQTPEKAPCAPL